MNKRHTEKQKKKRSATIPDTKVTTLPQVIAQQTFTCSTTEIDTFKSTTETLGKSMKYVHIFRICLSAILYFSPNDSPSKTIVLFSSSKKLFSFARY